MIIKANTFRAWLHANLDRRQLRELAEHGADAGWPGLTYYRDTTQLYARYRAEIVSVVADLADDCGQTLCGFLAGLTVQPGCADTLENLLVWIAAEKYARDITDRRNTD